MFLDGEPRAVGSGQTVRDLVRGVDRALDALLETGAAYVTDGVGRAIAPDAVVYPGAIYRLVRSARRPGAGPA